jgi:hypothetical protein
MIGIRRKVTAIAALALTALAVTASSGAAAASPANTRILGAVPHHSRPIAAMEHNLMSTAAVGAIKPTTLTFDASYETLINRYFTDVAHDSGTGNNVYSVATQYSDSIGNIKYQSTFGGAYVDHDPLPTSGCNDGVDQFCLTDSQLQQEIQAVLHTKGWTGDGEQTLNHIYFLMTPQGVGSCVEGNNLCSTDTFCAYHSAFIDDAVQDVVYANEPYLGPDGGCAGNGQTFPHDVDADTTINTISHEQNESITDPLGNAWLSNDANQDEVADLCAYVFGAQSGGINQTINGHQYDLQEEWSNADTNVSGDGCVQKLGGVPSATSPVCAPCSGPVVNSGGGFVMRTNTAYAIYWLPTAGNIDSPAVTGKPQVKQTLTTTQGTWSDNATSYSFQWQRCSAAGTSCANISGATAATYKLTTADEGHSVRSAVTAINVNGPSQAADSDFTATVVGSPVASKPPTVSGRAKVGHKLTASKGTWLGPPKTFSFQWLRCNGGGGACKAIGKATKSKYTLTKKDARHRLRVRVTATNAVGTKAALSRATARVPAAK